MSTEQDKDDGEPKIRRLNKLPLFLVIGAGAIFTFAVFWGLSSRGIFSGKQKLEAAIGMPANNFAEQLKQGAPNGVVEQPRVEQPKTDPDGASAVNPFQRQAAVPALQKAINGIEDEAIWRARLEREQKEIEIRRQHQQRMARVEADDKAFDSPIVVTIPELEKAEKAMAQSANNAAGGAGGNTGGNRTMSDLYAASLQAQQQQLDPNGQGRKEDFLNGQAGKAGYLGKPVVAQQSPFELKRGSVIPATLISGINSDLPGRITAQVGQHIYDSATGRQLLIPQGAKLLGRYDSKVSFGQSRVLVVWTDLIFPDGSTLQLGAMPGMDTQGYGGFSDQIDRKYLQIFGSAALIALFGAGMDMALPQQSQTAAATVSTTQSASDAARRSFAETFGRVAERTISRNMDVQPTLTIRPGYVFNVLVEQDIVFPGVYR